MNQIAHNAHLSRMLFEGGAKSYGAHILTLQRLYRLHWTLEGIHQDIMRPGTRKLTSLQMKDQADRRRHMATSIKLGGGQVRPEYE